MAGNPWLYYISPLISWTRNILQFAVTAPETRRSRTSVRCRDHLDCLSRVRRKTELDLCLWRGGSLSLWASSMVHNCTKGRCQQGRRPMPYGTVTVLGSHFCVALSPVTARSFYLTPLAAQSQNLKRECSSRYSNHLSPLMSDVPWTRAVCLSPSGSSRPRERRTPNRRLDLLPPDRNGHSA